QHLAGSVEVRSALEELVQTGRRAAAEYLAAERVVTDHRIQEALAQLRQDHERHVRELSLILREVGGSPVGWDGARAAGPVADAVSRGVDGGPELVDAIRRAEAELHETYALHVSRRYAEPLRTVLVRLRREEEAHVEWLKTSDWWGGGRGDA